MAKQKDDVKGWSWLNTALPEMTEKDCAEMLARERKEGRRVSFLLRIYGRFNKLRTQRERRELVKG